MWRPRLLASMKPDRVLGSPASTFNARLLNRQNSSIHSHLGKSGLLARALRRTMFKCGECTPRSVIAQRRRGHGYFSQLLIKRPFLIQNAFFSGHLSGNYLSLSNIICAASSWFPPSELQVPSSTLRHRWMTADQGCPAKNALWTSSEAAYFITCSRAKPLWFVLGFKEGAQRVFLASARGGSWHRCPWDQLVSWSRL